jgi:hypothetical protein
MIHSKSACQVVAVTGMLLLVSAFTLLSQIRCYRPNHGMAETYLVPSFSFPGRNLCRGRLQLRATCAAFALYYQRGRCRARQGEDRRGDHSHPETRH